MTRTTLAGGRPSVFDSMTLGERSFLVAYRPLRESGAPAGYVLATPLQQALSQDHVLSLPQQLDGLATLLRDAYLETWAGAAPRDRLLEAYELARPLYYAHQAVSYQHINASLEDAAQVDFPGEAARYVRHVLDQFLNSEP